MTLPTKRQSSYVYALLDPRRPGIYKYGKLKFKYEPFYIGKGGATNNRPESHSKAGSLRRDLKRLRDPHKARKILKIQKETGKTPIVRIIKSNLPDDDTAFHYERKAIALIGRKHEDGPLTNKTEGGEGFKGHIQTPEAIVRRVKSYKKTVSKRSAKYTKQIKQNIIEGLKKFIQDNPERRAEMDQARSDTAQARTPKQKKKLSKKFRDAQHAMSDSAKRKKNAKVSKGNKEYQANLTDTEKQKISEAGTNAQIKNWSKLNTAQRSTRSQVSADTIRNTPGKLKQKNNNIASGVSAQHLSQTPEQKAVRKFNTMVGGLCSNAVKRGELSAKNMPLVKEELRAKGARFYSRTRNINICPKRLRTKCMTHIAA